MSAPSRSFEMDLEIEVEPRSQAEIPTPMDSRARFAEVSSVLRGAGSFALVAALSTFLWQHWQTGSDVVRAGTLLVHTGALTLAGLFCGLRGQDGKAARTFLGLAGASLPIVGSVAGGLVYSQFALDGLRQVPAYATWVAPTATAAAAAAAVALVASLPVALLSMGVLARRCLAPLATAVVLGNALLLVPTRHPDTIAGLAAALLAGLVWIEMRWLRREPSLATFEGGLARALVLAPPLFLLGRSALHYDLSPFFYTLVCVSAALALSGLSWLGRLPEELRATLRWFAILPAGWGSVAFAAAAVDAGPFEGLALPVGGAFFAAQLVAASIPAGSERWGSQFRQLAAWSLTTLCALNLWVESGVVSSLLAGVSALIVLAWGTLREQRGLQLLGAAGALAAVGVHVQHAIELYAWSRWGSLALLGAGVILAASWVERVGPSALRRFERWQRSHSFGGDARV